MASTREVMIRENRIIIALLGILTIIAIGVVLYQARSIFLPFALAVFISYVLNPLISFFEKRRIPGAISILLALLVTFLILNLTGVLMYTSIRSFAAEFPKYQERLTNIIWDIINLLKIPPEIISAEAGTAQKFNILSAVQNFSLYGIITTTMNSLLNFLSNTILVLLFLLFILMGRNQLNQKIPLAFRPQTSLKIAEMVTNINLQIQKYLLAKTIISLVTGFLATIVLYYFDVEFALIWGILTFLLNFIPNIGSVIATILPLMIAFIQFDSLVKVLWIALGLMFIQFIMGNLLDPRIIGSSLNLSPLVVLFSLIFWGWLWGIIGMFLAVPLMVIIKITFENIDSLRFISVLMSKG